MNILNANRKLRHSQERVRRFAARRQKAKDKVRWDKLYGDKMAHALETLYADRRDIEDMLKTQGYYHWAQ